MPKVNRGARGLPGTAGSSLKAILSITGKLKDWPTHLPGPARYLKARWRNLTTKRPSSKERFLLYEFLLGNGVPVDLLATFMLSKWSLDDEGLDNLFFIATEWRKGRRDWWYYDINKRAWCDALGRKSKHGNYVASAKQTVRAGARLAQSPDDFYRALTGHSIASVGPAKILRGAGNVNVEHQRGLDRANAAGFLANDRANQRHARLTHLYDIPENDEDLQDVVAELDERDAWAEAANDGYEEALEGAMEPDVNYADRRMRTGGVKRAARLPPRENPVALQRRRIRAAQLAAADDMWEGPEAGPSPSGNLALARDALIASSRDTARRLKNNSRLRAAKASAYKRSPFMGLSNR
jgi:hypothetical protein